MTKYEKKMKNGKQNPKFVDLLEVDKPIAGQNFGCFSFVTPEKIIKQKELFFFQEFLKKWDFTKSMEKFAQFLNFLSFKYKLSLDDLMKDYEEFIKEEQEILANATIEDDYKTFMDRNEERLDKKFSVDHNFQTSVKGFKFRGTYPSQEEAELRCKMLREADPNFDIFVGPVGQWLCWDPDAYKTGRTEFMEEELNQLMHEKHKNEAFAKTAFDQRLKESKQKAMEENIKSAEKTGNALTQSIDDDGNLIGINTQENALRNNENLTISDIRKEMFEGENVVIGKTDNGRSQLLSGPFAK